MGHGGPSVKRWFAGRPEPLLEPRATTRPTDTPSRDLRPTAGEPDISTDAEILRLSYRVDALEHHGRTIGAELRDLREQVDSMTKADEIAHAVAAELDSRRRARFTFTRKTGAIIAGAILLVPALHDAFLWLG